jgi:hypothetical protein
VRRKIAALLKEAALLQTILTRHVPNWQEEYRAILLCGEADTRMLVRQRLEPMRKPSA